MRLDSKGVLSHRLQHGSMWASTPTDKRGDPLVGADAHIRPELLADLIAFSYDELRLIGACHKVSYPTIKKCFLETYPEIVEFGIEAAA